MMKGFKFIVLIACTLTVVTARAQYYSINIDVKTAAAMASAYATETVAETYYNEQLSKIREHYQAAEVAAAGIFAAKYLDRKALTDLGLWTSSTENYYYRRIYHMVSAKIMPKIWTVAGMMLKSPHNALYWGTYLMKVCEETKTLCYQFESIVTNSRLTFSDIAFLEISQDIADILKLSELGGMDWKGMLDNMSNIGNYLTVDNLKEDINNLYEMGVSLASAGVGNVSGAILQGSTFNGVIDSKIGSVITIADNIYTLYEQLDNDAGGTILGLIGGQEGLANLFNLSNYNVTSWITDYAREGMGQYYTQRWYIYRRDYGSEVLCDYNPPTDDNSIIYGSQWYRIATTDPNYTPTSSEYQAILHNSENDAGWSRERVNQLNNSHDGFTYNFSYYTQAYIISRSNSGQYAKSYADRIYVTKSWDNQEVVYEDVFDSYTMDINTFKAGMNARLAEYNDNDQGYRYYLGHDAKSYYQTTDAKKLEGCETVTISITCNDGAKLGEGSTQYKCNSCGGSPSAHTKECSMATTLTESTIDTSELDSQCQEAESEIALLQSQIDALEAENSELLKLISQSSIEEAVTYRKQYNTNKDKISQLNTQLTSWKNKLKDIQQAQQEAAEGEAVITDDYYRIPAIMQDCKTAYNLTWQDGGSWNGYTFTRTATMPNIRGTVTFKAEVSIARRPKYFLGIKIHRAIVQISWTLTTSYSDTQVVDVIELDPSKSDQEKADEVNARLSEIAQEYPSCQISTEYAKSAPAEEDDTEDTYHLLWSSDRLEIAREIDSRLTKIYADLVSLEKMMHYKHSIIDLLKEIAPYINDEDGRRLTLLEQCRRRWLRHAANSSHSVGYNGKYDDDEDNEE